MADAFGRLQVLVTQLQGALGGNRVVRGSVSSSGSITAGAGFSVSKTGTGTYVVTFSTAFASAPSVVVSAGSTGSTTGARVSVTPTTSGFTVATFVPAGTNTDGEWHFVASGP